MSPRESMKRPAKSATGGFGAYIRVTLAGIHPAFRLPLGKIRSFGPCDPRDRYALPAAKRVALRLIDHAGAP